MVPWQIDAFPDEVDEALGMKRCKRADGIREFLKHRTGPMTARRETTYN
jgi:putative transposase